MKNDDHYGSTDHCNVDEAKYKSYALMTFKISENTKTKCLNFKLVSYDLLWVTSIYHVVRALRS